MEITRLANSTTLWEADVRYKSRSHPYNCRPPIRMRALSEAAFLDQLAHYIPDVEVIPDQYGNPRIRRVPTTT